MHCEMSAFDPSGHWPPHCDPFRRAGLSQVNEERQAQNQELNWKNYEGWLRENLDCKARLLASQEKVFELQDKLLSLRQIINSVTLTKG